MVKKEDYKINNFYQGSQSTLNSEDYSPTGNYTGFKLSASRVGGSVNPTVANQLKEVNAMLNQGVIPIELGVMDPKIFEVIPKEHFKEINRVAKLTGADISVHAPIIEASGIGEKGWDESARQLAEEQLKNVIDKTAPLNEKGGMSINFHGSGGAHGMTYKMTPDGKKEDVIPIINVETGQITAAKEEIHHMPGTENLKKGITDTPRDQIQTIYLFRHGKTVYNTKGIFTGQSTSNLTWIGKLNAKKVARKLKKKKFEVAIHTKLQRSKDTLKYVLKYHPECKKLIEDNRIIERSYGDLQGMTHKNFIKRIGKREIDLRIEGDALENLSPRMRKKAEKFLGQIEYDIIHRGWNTPAPGGESFKDVEERVKPFIKWLKKYMKKNKVSVAISAHGNSIRLFRKIVEKASIPKAVKWFIPYDKIFEYDVDEL